MSLRLGNTVIAGSIDTDSLLPKTGGTMTGPIELNATAENGVIVKQKANTSKVGLTGGTSWENGAGLDLYGKEYNDANVKGIFDIFANDGVNTVKKLTGKPNGQLLWNGMRVPTIVSTYINATSDINGNLNISSVRPTNGIPLAFIGNGSAMGTETARYCFMTGGYYMSFSNSGATWEAWGNQPIAGTIYWMVL